MKNFLLWNLFARRFLKAAAGLSITLWLLPISLGGAQEGVLSFIDLDPTPPELFENCLSAALDIEGVLECTTNTELVNVEEFMNCAGQAACERYAYSAPMFPEKIGQVVKSTYDDLWQRNIDDIYDYAYDAWRDNGCVIATLPEVSADVMLYGAGDASLRYWSEVFVASSYYLPASLWWQTPFPGLLSGESERIITPIFSLIPNPEQYLELGQEASSQLALAGVDRSIYYFQPPAFPSNPVPFEDAELIENLPGIPAFERLKSSLGPASALEYSQFGHASFFEVYGKRRVVDIFTVWVKECVPTPKTSPLAVFVVPLLPKAETRVTTAAEGYELSKLGKQSWFPDPMSAFEANTLEEAADRMMQNPNYTDPVSLSPLDPKGSLLNGFINTRIPLAKDVNIPQEVVDDAKSGGSGADESDSSEGDLLGGLGGGAAGEEERESLADVLGCPPVILGPNGVTPHPILAIKDQRLTRPQDHYHQSIQYLFKDTADGLYSDETRRALGEFIAYFELPDVSDPASWRTSSSGYGRASLSSGSSSVGGKAFGISFGGGGGPDGVLCVGDKGSEVATLDRLLARAGFGGGNDANEFDEDTQQNLMDFQESVGLTPDGLSGPETWAALHANAAQREDPQGYQLPTQGAGPGKAWQGGFRGGRGGAQDNAPQNNAPQNNAPDSSDPSSERSVGSQLKFATAATALQTTRPMLAQASAPQGGETQEGGEAQEGGEQVQGEAPLDSVSIALKILDNPNIRLWDGSAKVLGDAELLLEDGSDPLSNIMAAARGEPAKRSDFNGVPSGDTWLSPYMLEGLLEVAKFHQIDVIAIAGGVHPLDSRHYEGAAFAINAINDVAVADMPIQIEFDAQAVAPIEGGVVPEGSQQTDLTDASSSEREEDGAAPSLLGAVSGGNLHLPKSINGEPIDELFKPNEEDGLGGAIKGALDILNPLPLDLATMTEDDLMDSDDISDSFDRNSPNTMLQVIALCELAFATDVYSPFNEERSSVQCNWPTAQEVASGEA